MALSSLPFSGIIVKVQWETGCRIAADPAERAWIEDVDLQNRERPVPGFGSLVGGSVRIDSELVDGDGIVPDKDRDLAMTVLHSPGLISRSMTSPWIGAVTPTAPGSAHVIVSW